MRKFNFMAVMVGFMGSVGITTAAVVIMGLYVFISNNSIFNFPGPIMFLMAVSLLVGGYISGKRAYIGGILNGGITGLGYAIFLLILQAQFFPEFFTIGDIIAQCLVFPAIASVGGVVGVNAPQSYVSRGSRQFRRYV